MAVIGIVAAMLVLRLGGLRGGSAATASAAQRIAPRYPFLYRASLNKWWFDDLNDLLFVVIGGRVAGSAVVVRPGVIDGTVNGIGALTQTPAAAFAASRPAASRTTRWASPSGCSSWPARSS